MANSQKSEYDAYLCEVAKYILKQDADERILQAHEQGVVSGDPHTYRMAALARSYAELLAVTEHDLGLYGAVRGSLLTGFEIYGPFSTVEQAADWAEERSVVLGPMTIMPIRPPENCGVQVNKP